MLIKCSVCFDSNKIILCTWIRDRQNTKISIAVLLVHFFWGSYAMKKKISKSYLFNIISPTHIIFPNITLLIHSQRKINLTYFIPNLTFFFSTIKSQIYLIVSDFNSLMSCPRNRSCVSGFEPPPRSVTSSCGLSGAAINSQPN